MFNLGVYYVRLVLVFSNNCLCSYQYTVYSFMLIIFMYFFIYGHKFLILPNIAVVYRTHTLFLQWWDCYTFDCLLRSKVGLTGFSVPFEPSLILKEDHM